LLVRYFPAVARRAEDAEAWWQKAAQEDGVEPFKLLFRRFFTATINATMKGQLADMVVVPHLDVKNVAAGLCAVFVFGEFFLIIFISIWLKLGVP
jgi:hypothetical protein